MSGSVEVQILVVLVFLQSSILLCRQKTGRINIACINLRLISGRVCAYLRLPNNKMVTGIIISIVIVEVGGKRKRRGRRLFAVGNS